MKVQSTNGGLERKNYDKRRRIMTNTQQIHKINEYLKEQLWMDFEMCNMNGGKLEMSGFFG